MRLHSLEVTAFGPFAGTERVDFDALNDAGLFLLTGATGAGKSSILDAVCFALYGQVPGARGVKSLKSQHAGDLARPEVVLDVSVRERRFVLRRSPEWSRPKLRGTGTRVEKASASLVELLPDGQERFLTSRAAEVGLQVTSLIGMQAAQFQQVAMLPQGEFARFLHAGSGERHDVLQQLFRTDRFARIEQWVHEHSRELREHASSSRIAVERLLHALAERTGAETPAWAEGDALAVAAGEGLVVPWADALLHGARAPLPDLAARSRAATAALTGARTRAEAARVRLRLQQRRDEALMVAAELAGAEAEVAAARAALAADARAAACLPLLDLNERTAREAATTADARDRLLATLSFPAAGDGPCVATSDLLAQARERHAALSALLPRARRLREDSASVRVLTARLATLAQDRSRLVAGQQEAPARRAALAARLASAEAQAAEVPVLELRLEAAAAVLRAAAALPSARAAAVQLADAARAAHDRALDARARVLDLAGRRLAGMAAELAGDLREGEPCAVCGSEDHPVPAGGGSDPVTPPEQQAADAAAEAAHRDHADAVRAATAAEHRVAELSAGSGDLDPPTATRAVDALADALAAGRRAVGSLDDLRGAVADLALQAERAAARVDDLEQETATVRARLVALGEAVDRATAEVAAVAGPALDPRDPDRLACEVADLDERLDRLQELDALQAGHASALTRLAELTAEADAVTAAQGFAGADQVAAAVLDDRRRARLTELVQHHDRAAAGVAAVLAEQAGDGLSGVGRPDVAAAERSVGEAEAAASGARTSLEAQQRLEEAVSGLRSRLLLALGEWEPLRESFVRTESMARLVRGMGGDNQFQMRLSAYVLARRLDQVLDAANERLAHMRDQRYLLQRTARAARRTGQAGLGLEVLDQWTGDVREPTTLSGGETFVVSLALALGLADVVTQEAGGTEIETLFVDEGFGTLDAETLDDVMDRLDGLRAGGRTVGVVSHVAELRDRIPHQVHVSKSPQGSTIRARALLR